MIERKYNKVAKNENNKKDLLPFFLSFEALLVFITLITITQIIPNVVIAQAPTSTSSAAEADDTNNDNNNNSSNTSTIIRNDRNNNTISNQPLAYNLSQLFEKVEGSVVQVSNKILPSSTMNNNYDNNSNGLFGTTLGSGFVYDNNGHIVTNYHVVTGGVVPIVGDNNKNNTEEIRVTFQDGTISDATIVGMDPYSDLAVLKLTGDAPKDKLVPLQFGSSSGLKVGERVAAIGNPFGLSGTMSEGIISGLGRQLPLDISADLQEQQPPQQQQQQQQSPLLAQNIPSFSIPNIIQTDAAMNPGNSGGPLLDMRGEVIGVNIAIFSATGAYSGVGLAIPSDEVKKIIPSLISTGTYRHPYVGIAGVDISPGIAELIGLEEVRGFLVTEITEGSPAAKAGLRGGYIPTNVDGMIIDMGGDVILRVDNKPVRIMEDLTSYIESEKDIGDTLTLRILREGRIDDIGLTLATRPGLETIIQNISLSQERNQAHSRG
jgi:S1-C subfamily serine protease